MSHISIYLDESGCLGFSEKSSRYLVITILKIDNSDIGKNIFQTIKRTIKSKLSHKNKRDLSLELKGSQTSLEIKEYFYNKIPKMGWGLYSYILNKDRVNSDLRTPKGSKKLYNFIVKELL